MPRYTTKDLISSGVITTSLLARILNCSKPFIIKLCRNKIIAAQNISTTPGKYEFRIHPSDAIDYCRNKLGLTDKTIPPVLFELEKKIKQNIDELYRLINNQEEIISLSNNLILPSQDLIIVKENMFDT